MTVIERRFRGRRYDYEVKYTVESQRFDELAPTLRKSLDSVGEVPGVTPEATGPAGPRDARADSRRDGRGSSPAW
jgi:hypothetical protein